MDQVTFEKRTGLTEADMMALDMVPVFSGLGENVLVDLLSDSSVRHYPRDTMLFLQGDEADRFFVVFDGWVKLFRQTPDGHESVVHVCGPKDSFAEAAIFDSHDFPVSAEVVEDARLLVIPAKRFIAQLHESMDICLTMIGALSRHNRFLVKNIEQMAVKSSAERLALFLDGLCGKHCNGICDSCEINLPLDKGLIAGRLNMQPETLSRSFVKLKNLGVETKGSRVLVENMERLRTFANGQGGD